ncbi:MAG TPA: hypothetical protein VGS41_04375 [Chthonomonadales bacterium]|nr:hypothetical protein [Chthonomonadales bacterium]
MSVDERTILETANELAGLKAYQPEQPWTFESLKEQIAQILRKHLNG